MSVILKSDVAEVVVGTLKRRWKEKDGFLVEQRRESIHRALKTDDNRTVIIIDIWQKHGSFYQRRMVVEVKDLLTEESVL